MVSSRCVSEAAWRLLQERRCCAEGILGLSASQPQYRENVWTSRTSTPRRRGGAAVRSPIPALWPGHRTLSTLPDYRPFGRGPGGEVRFQVLRYTLYIRKVPASSLTYFRKIRKTDLLDYLRKFGQHFDKHWTLSKKKVPCVYWEIGRIISHSLWYENCLVKIARSA